MISGEDISFEAIATPGIQSEYGMVHQIKQDITGEEEDDNDGQAAAGETMEEKRRRKSMIGAYRSDQDDGLPAEKGFAIQIGSEVFRLSGASIMSDGV